jgi:hypothetical protein
LAIQVILGSIKISKSILTPKINNKLYRILRVVEPAFKSYIKVKYNEKVNNKP